ncbi:MAG TPA: putative Ig domain-containing protein [Planctomycetota bacterium]|nr:putative Ig domain-containing protein [Planctomycetota bacterium]
MRSLRPALGVACALALVACNSSSSGSGSSSGLTSIPANGAFLNNAVAQSPYTQTITFSGGSEPYTVTAPQGTPAGLTLSASGNTATLSGTPSTAGTGAFELQVVDGSSRTTILTYALRILASTAGLTISPTTLPSGISNVTYDQTLTLSGGTQPFTWSFVPAQGSLPPGLTLSSTTTASNAITGTPTTPGTYSFQIQVTDSSNPVLTGVFPYTIVVN